MDELTNELTIGKEEFKALSSDTRIEIIKLLNERNYTLSEISAKLKMSSPTIKQHLEMLVHSDLIKQKDEGRKWKYYSLTRKGKKISEPESHNVMILLSATIIGCLFLVYVIFGTNLVTETGINAPEKASLTFNEQYSDLASGTAENEDKRTTETIQEILGKSKNITNIEFDLVEQTNGTVKKSKYYLRDEKYRTETEIENTKVTQIYDGNNLYSYKGYSKDEETSLESIADALPLAAEDPAGIKQSVKQALSDPELKEIGLEVVNGLNTRVIEYTYNKQKIKAWVSEDYGITVKKETEIEIQGKIVKQITELKNIKINSVTDSLFKIN